MNYIWLHAKPWPSMSKSIMICCIEKEISVESWLLVLISMKTAFANVSILMLMSLFSVDKNLKYTVMRMYEIHVYSVIWYDLKIKENIMKNPDGSKVDCELSSKATNIWLRYCYWTLCWFRHVYWFSNFSRFISSAENKDLSIKRE